MGGEGRGTGWVGARVSACMICLPPPHAEPLVFKVWALQVEPAGTQKSNLEGLRDEKWHQKRSLVARIGRDASAAVSDEIDAFIHRSNQDFTRL